jgi:hypothetical protein
MKHAYCVWNRLYDYLFGKLEFVDVCKLQTYVLTEKIEPININANWSCSKYIFNLFAHVCVCLCEIQLLNMTNSILK